MSIYMWDNSHILSGVLGSSTLMSFAIEGGRKDKGFDQERKIKERVWSTHTILQPWFNLMEKMKAAGEFKMIKEWLEPKRLNYICKK